MMLTSLSWSFILLCGVGFGSGNLTAQRYMNPFACCSSNLCFKNSNIKPWSLLCAENKNIGTLKQLIRTVYLLF